MSLGVSVGGAVAPGLGATGRLAGRCVGTWPGLFTGAALGLFTGAALGLFTVPVSG